MPPPVTQSFQALCPVRANNVASVTGTTARTTSAIASNVVELAPSVDMHIKFGDSDIEATTSDPKIKGGVVYTYAKNPYGSAANTHLAAIKASGASDGELAVIELE